MSPTIPAAIIPGSLKIDYSGYIREMSAEAYDLMLSQFRNGPVFRQYLALLVDAGPQWTYDETIRFIEANSLYEAKGGNLDAIGNIVGRPRTAYAYDDSTWFMADNENQGGDSAPCWVAGAPLAAYTQMGDETYRQAILARIACNFNKFSSVPELLYYIRLVTGENVSFVTVGPMEAQVLVRSGISNTALNIITQSTTTAQCDDEYAVPYPATLNLSAAIYAPEGYFCTDTLDERQCDIAPCAVSVPLNVKG